MRLFRRKKEKEPLKKYTLMTDGGEITLDVKWDTRAVERAAGGSSVHYHSIAQYFNFKTEKMTQVDSDSSYALSARAFSSGDVTTTVTVTDFAAMTDEAGKKSLAAAYKYADQIRHQRSSSYKMVGDEKDLLFSQFDFVRETDDIWSRRRSSEGTFVSGDTHLCLTSWTEYYDFKAGQVTFATSDARYALTGPDRGTALPAENSTSVRSFQEIMTGDSFGDDERKAFIGAVLAGLYEGKDIARPRTDLRRLALPGR